MSTFSTTAQRVRWVQRTILHMSFLPFRQVIQRNQNLTSKTADPPSAAILVVYLDQAEHVPVRTVPCESLVIAEKACVECPSLISIDVLDCVFLAEERQGSQPCGTAVPSGYSQREQGKKAHL